MGISQSYFNISTSIWSTANTEWKIEQWFIELASYISLSLKLSRSNCLVVVVSILALKLGSLGLLITVFIQ